MSRHGVSNKGTPILETLLEKRRREKVVKISVKYLVTITSFHQIDRENEQWKSVVK